jgi:hypothetical protein
MKKPSSTLIRVAEAHNRYVNAKTEARARIEREVLAEVMRLQLDFEDVVVRAAETEQVVNIARAITPPESTPNRAKVYAILRRHGGMTRLKTAEYPIEWVARDVEGFDGTYTVYDAVGTFSGFGPAGISGEYTWAYDRGDLVPEYDPEAPTYPTDREYQNILKTWLIANPYPGVES